MPCIEGQGDRRRFGAGRVVVVGWTIAVAGLFGGCTGHGSSQPEASASATGPAPLREGGQASAHAASAPVAGGKAAAHLPLPAPARMRNWAEVRQQAAERLVAANPNGTYMGKVPDRLLAIPVLEIELNGDGSVRRIDILRAPREAKETLKLATDAIARAAPFGDVSRLPKPWRFVETFLFDDERKFKPRTLDQ